MKNTTTLLVLCAVLSTSNVWAQAVAPAKKTAAQEPKEKKVQRIRTEDDGARIDETRVGGETQNITVQPKVGDMPAYEVKPADNNPAAGTGGAGSGGKRMWNVHNF